MNPKWEKLYKEFEADIARCLALEHPEKENVENCFWIARNYWEQLQAVLKSNGFKYEAEEIEFYREVKPVFARHIEYFSLLSEALNFQPPLVPFPGEFAGKVNEADWIKAQQDSMRDYWKMEEQRGNRFYTKNQDFLDYFESGSREHDKEYFLTRSTPPREIAYRRSHNRDTELFTVHEELLTTWQAFKMYKDYIKTKVHEPAQG